jgi:uncharacterized protein
MAVITQALIQKLRAQFILDWEGIHGSPHWARVRANGLKLAEDHQVNTAIIELFAFLHDSRRIDDNTDPFHGTRAVQFIEELRDDFIDLNDNDYAHLIYACEHHSDGLMKADAVVKICWDADRLDLGRVGIKPDPLRLCTKAARQDSVINWAYARSIRGTAW